MKLSIKTNFPDVQRQLNAMHKDVVKSALPSALNKTVAQAKTAMSKEIRAEFNITAAKVNASLKVNRANFKNGLYSVEASLESPSKRGRSLNLINFAARQTARGVTIKIKKGGARKLIRTAFIANQGRTVFKRTGEPKRIMSKGFNAGKLREPITSVQTIEVAQMFNTRRINKKVVEFMQTKFPAIFAHESKFFLDRFNQGRAR